MWIPEEGEMGFIHTPGGMGNTILIPGTLKHDQNIQLDAGVSSRLFGKTESQAGLGWKGPAKVLFDEKHQTHLPLNAILSSLVWNVSRDGASTPLWAAGPGIHHPHLKKFTFSISFRSISLQLQPSALVPHTRPCCKICPLYEDTTIPAPGTLTGQTGMWEPTGQFNTRHSGKQLLWSGLRTDLGQEQGPAGGI